MRSASGWPRRLDHGCCTKNVPAQLRGQLQPQQINSQTGLNAKLEKSSHIYLTWAEWQTALRTKRRNRNVRSYGASASLLFLLYSFKKSLKCRACARCTERCLEPHSIWLWPLMRVNWFLQRFFQNVQTDPESYAHRNTSRLVLL